MTRQSNLPVVWLIIGALLVVAVLRGAGDFAALLLLLLVITGGALLGTLAWFKALRLSRQVDQLQSRLEVLEPQRTIALTTETAPGVEPTPEPFSTADRTVAAEPVPAEATSLATRLAPGLSWLQANWMLLLGGLCVVLAGIFLVRYSIEQGLLSPIARISLTLFTGFALHAAAEWLRRRTGRNHPVFEALSGGGSITLYSATLAAVHLYHLVPPLAAFGFLALVSLATMLLAVRHGPVLACIGIIGGYLVPILIGDSSLNIISSLIYSLIISVAALILTAYVYRPWLWGSILTGATLWWSYSMEFSQADGFRSLYIAILAYSILALPKWDLLLQRRVKLTAPGALLPQLLSELTRKPEPGSRPGSGERHTLIGMLVLIGMQGFTIQAEPFLMAAVPGWVLLTGLFFVIARHKQPYMLLPWLALLVQLAAWASLGLHWNADTLVLDWEIMAMPPGLMGFLGSMAALYLAGSCWNMYATDRYRALWLALAVLSPLCWLTLMYLLATSFLPQWEWSIASVLLGLSYMAVTGWLRQTRPRDTAVVWPILGAHLAYALAVTMAFRETGLTLALAAQVLSLAWAICHFKLHILHWLLKAVLAIIILRLSLNPWVLSYPSEVHWSVWTYGGATLFCGLAAWKLRKQPEIGRWVEAVTLHLAVLALWTELRYWLYAGEIFVHRYELQEAAINTTLWAALGMVYYLRGQRATQVAIVYHWAARILMGMALLNYIAVLLPLNPLWNEAQIAQTRIWNLLLLAYGAPVIMALLARRYFEPRFSRIAAGVAGVTLFIFVSLEIRHLWQGALDLDRFTRDGELYTYSIVWLLMAVAAILAGGLRYGAGLYRGGMALLALVIAKIFLVDAGDLTGLLRASAFMGLGLCLLGLTYLHQRFGTTLSVPRHPD